MESSSSSNTLNSSFRKWEIPAMSWHPGGNEWVKNKNKKLQNLLIPFIIIITAVVVISVSP